MPHVLEQRNEDIFFQSQCNLPSFPQQWEKSLPVLQTHNSIKDSPKPACLREGPVTPFQYNTSCPQACLHNTTHNQGFWWGTRRCDIFLYTKEGLPTHADLQIALRAQACIPQNACEHMKMCVHSFAYSQKRKYTDWGGMVKVHSSITGGPGRKDDKWVQNNHRVLVFETPAHT